MAEADGRVILRRRGERTGAWIAAAETSRGAAEAAGAEIVFAPKDEDHGGRSYSARDREGHLRTFGSYDPYAKAGENA